MGFVNWFKKRKQTETVTEYYYPSQDEYDKFIKYLDGRNMDFVEKHPSRIYLHEVDVISKYTGKK